MRLTKAQRAAHKAWETRRKQHPEKYGPKRRKKGTVVGFYKDEKKRTRPITKSTKELKRKKIVKKPREFKGVKPKRLATVMADTPFRSKMFTRGYNYGRRQPFGFSDKDLARFKRRPHLFVERMKSYGVRTVKQAKLWLKGYEFARKQAIRRDEEQGVKHTKSKKWAKDVLLKKGALKELGYDPWSSARKRHEALKKSIKKAGLETTRKRIQFLANVTPDRKKLDKVYKEDLAWLKAKWTTTARLFAPKSKAEQLRTIMEREKPSKRGTGVAPKTIRGMRIGTKQYSKNIDKLAITFFTRYNIPYKPLSKTNKKKLKSFLKQVEIQYDSSIAQDVRDNINAMLKIVRKEKVSSVRISGSELKKYQKWLSRQSERSLKRRLGADWQDETALWTEYEHDTFEKPKSKAEQLRTIMEKRKPSKRTPRKKRGRGKPLTEPQKEKRHPKLKQTQDVRVYRQPALRTWRYQSKSSPGKYYTTRLNEDESLSCNCPGWIFSKKPKSCRHTRDVHTKHKVG